jgi:2-keto-4-pentenoate hydratase
MTASDIARRLTDARRNGHILEAYPGDVPAEMSQSYAVQDRAIELWSQPVQGWKIGRLAPNLFERHQTERLAGPIFASSVQTFGDGPMHVDVYSGGSAAVEAEYVFRIAHDADPERLDYDDLSAFALINCLNIGIEMAGSPLVAINSRGPTVVASDFGNNNGLLLGPVLMTFSPGTSPHQLEEAIHTLKAETLIDGQVVGKGGLSSIPGGPLSAIAWLAGHVARRGRPLTKGQFISSGAVTGIHDIGPGKSAEVRFSDLAANWHALALHTFIYRASNATTA